MTLYQVIMTAVGSELFGDEEGGELTVEETEISARIAARVLKDVASFVEKKWTG